MSLSRTSAHDNLLAKTQNLEIELAKKEHLCSQTEAKASQKEKELNSELAQSKSDLEHYKNLYDEVKNQTFVKKQENSDEMEKIWAEKESILKEVADLKYENSEKEKELTSLKTEVKKAAKEAEKYKLELFVSEKKVDTLKIESESEIKGYQGEIEDLREKLQAAERKNRELEDSQEDNSETDDKFEALDMNNLLVPDDLNKFDDRLSAHSGEGLGMGPRSRVSSNSFRPKMPNLPMPPMRGKRNSIVATLSLMNMRANQKDQTDANGENGVDEKDSKQAILLDLKTRELTDQIKMLNQEIANMKVEISNLKENLSEKEEKERDSVRALSAAESKVQAKEIELEVFRKKVLTDKEDFISELNDLNDEIILRDKVIRKLKRETANAIA